MKKMSMVASVLLALIGLMFWIPRAHASSSFYTSYCSSCHGTTPNTCNGCHAHGTHSSSAKNNINIAGVTDKTTYAPGETISVTITGGYKTGWVRALLYDQSMVELKRSTGPSGQGGGAGYPITLTAPAPMSAGTYSWNVAWYGNKYDLTDAGAGTTFFGPRWTPDPTNANHGREIVSTNTFTVTAPIVNVPESILWYNTGSGLVWDMTTGGTQATTSGTVVYTEPTPATWSIVGKGDFDGDGVMDYVWWNSSTGEVRVMLMLNTSTVKSENTVWQEPNTAWRIVATGDLNGDKKTDLIWWNNATGQVFAMLMNGYAVSSSGVIWTEPNLNWKIVATGDLNGDGKTDIIWWNSTTGQVFAMLMNGLSVSSSAVIWTEPGVSNWRIAGTGDLNGDGKADLVWRSRSTGSVFSMLMNGLAVSSSGVIWTEPSLNWEIVSIGKYTTSNNAGLLWRNKTTGAVFLLPMNGLIAAPGSNVIWTEPAASWRIEDTTEWRNNAYGVGVTTP